MQEVLRSSVNTWDCDQMGHMNVRHYFGRANEGLAVLLLRHGLGPRQLRERGLVPRARDQHLRFMHELRPGAGFSVRASVVAKSPAQLTLYEELRTLKNELSATIVTECSLYDVRSAENVSWPVPLLDALPYDATAGIPAYAAARGVTAQAERSRFDREHAALLGMAPGYLGPITAEDCDAQGVMREAAFMGRIVDGISHTFAAIPGSARPAGIGGAALEYRFVFHAWPRLSDVIEVRSVVSALASKTMQVTHYVFNLETGECVASAQAVVAWFDLTTRKAVEIPGEYIAKLRDHVQPAISI
jgi:acyl-CoA thioester hydrolase